MDKMNREKTDGTCLAPSHNPAFVDKMDEIVDGINQLSIEENISYYIDGDNGDDTNDGLTWDSALKTFDFLWSEGMKPLPREINADVIVNCKGTILSVSTAGNFTLNGFYGTGTITIEGEWSDLQTDIVATAWDNDQASVTKKCYVEASAESWTVDEFKGKFILITSGTGVGTNYTPIMSNTATRLETQDLTLLGATTRFSIVEATKVRAALVSDPDTRIEYDAPNYTAFSFGGVSIDATIKTLDFTETAVPTGYNNSFYLGALRAFGFADNTAHILLENISAIAYQGFVDAQRTTWSRCAFFIDTFFYIARGSISFTNSILAGLGVASDGFMLVNPQALLSLDGSRLTDHLHGVSQSYSASKGGTVMLQVRNLFENCDIGIGTTNADVLIGNISASYPEGFLNCNTALLLASNSYIIGKTQQFNVVGVATEMQVDSINTATFADITANKVINNDSGGSVGYYDTATKEPYNPPKEDARIMSTLDVSNPPTAAELTAEFGSPSAVGAGFTICINDNGAGTNAYTCTSDGANWWVFTGVKAL